MVDIMSIISSMDNLERRRGIPKPPNHPAFLLEQEEVCHFQQSKEVSFQQQQMHALYDANSGRSPTASPPATITNVEESVRRALANDSALHQMSARRFREREWSSSCDGSASNHSIVSTERPYLPVHSTNMTGPGQLQSPSALSASLFQPIASFSPEKICKYCNLPEVREIQGERVCHACGGNHGSVSVASNRLLNGRLESDDPTVRGDMPFESEGNNSRCIANNMAQRRQQLHQQLQFTRVGAYRAKAPQNVQSKKGSGEFKDSSSEEAGRVKRNHSLYAANRLIQQTAVSEQLKRDEVLHSSGVQLSKLQKQTQLHGMRLQRELDRVLEKLQVSISVPLPLCQHAKSELAKVVVRHVKHSEICTSRLCTCNAFRHSDPVLAMIVLEYVLNAADANARTDACGGAYSTEGALQRMAKYVQTELNSKCLGSGHVRSFVEDAVKNLMGLGSDDESCFVCSQYEDSLSSSSVASDDGLESGRNIAALPPPYVPTPIPLASRVVRPCATLNEARRVGEPRRGAFLTRAQRYCNVETESTCSSLTESKNTPKTLPTCIGPPSLALQRSHTQSSFTSSCDDDFTFEWPKTASRFSPVNVPLSVSAESPTMGLSSQMLGLSTTSTSNTTGNTNRMSGSTSSLSMPVEEVDVLAKNAVVTFSSFNSHRCRQIILKTSGISNFVREFATKLLHRDAVVQTLRAHNIDSRSGAVALVSSVQKCAEAARSGASFPDGLDGDSSNDSESYDGSVHASPLATKLELSPNKRRRQTSNTDNGTNMLRVIQALNKLIANDKEVHMLASCTQDVNLPVERFASSSPIKMCESSQSKHWNW